MGHTITIRYNFSLIFFTKHNEDIILTNLIIKLSMVFFIKREMGGVDYCIDEVLPF